MTSLRDHLPNGATTFLVANNRPLAWALHTPDAKIVHFYDDDQLPGAAESDSVLVNSRRDGRRLPAPQYSMIAEPEEPGWIADVGSYSFGVSLGFFDPDRRLRYDAFLCIGLTAPWMHPGIWLKRPPAALKKGGILLFDARDASQWPHFVRAIDERWRDPSDVAVMFASVELVEVDEIGACWKCVA